MICLLLFGLFCCSLRKHLLLFLPFPCQHIISRLPCLSFGLRHTCLLFLCSVTIISSLRQVGPFRITLKSLNGPLTCFLICGHWQVFGTYWLSTVRHMLRLNVRKAKAVGFMLRLCLWSAQCRCSFYTLLQGVRDFPVVTFGNSWLMSYSHWFQLFKRESLLLLSFWQGSKIKNLVCLKKKQQHKNHILVFWLKCSVLL